MKKLFAVLLCLCFCTYLTACQKTDTHSLSQYDEGYYAGYESGLWDGAFKVRENIADEVWDLYSSIERQTTKERGLHPEEAIIVLNNYLDGEYVSDYDMETAIRSITYFYYHAWDVINDIEDIDIYLD